LLGLLVLLTTELTPAIQAVVRFPTAAELTIHQQGALSETESLGLVPFTLDDIFDRL
jgi:hypothetical protein